MITLDPSFRREQKDKAVRVRVVLEAAEGKPERYELAGDPPVWTLTDVLPVPWPAAYGFIPGTLCPGDGEAWDVIVLTPTSAPPLSSVTVDIVGVLLRADADHKLLGVLPDDATLGEPPDLGRIPAARRAAIEAMFGARSPITGWGGRDEALRLLTESGHTGGVGTVLPAGADRDK
jgi:inorganic pyrophosphatase